MKNAKLTKLELFKKGIVAQLKSEGLQDEVILANDLEVNKLAETYSLVEQCLWVRLKDEKTIQNLLSKFAETTQLARVLIDKHGFENLVYTFRSVYTNLYQVRGIGRKYNLSKESYIEFLTKVNDSSLVVLTKTSKKSKTSKQAKTSNTSTMQDSFASLLKLEDTSSKQPSKVVKQVETKTTKVVKGGEKVASESIAMQPIQPQKQDFSKIFVVKQEEQPKVVKQPKVNPWKIAEKQLQVGNLVKIELIDGQILIGTIKNIRSFDNEVKTMIENRKGKYEVKVNQMSKVYIYVSSKKH